MSGIPRILAVEDNPITGTALGCELRECGLEIVVSPSAEDALSQLSAGLKVDLIILDFHLPGEQGPDFYRRLGMDPKYGKIPVIPFTSQIEATTANSTSLTSGYATQIQTESGDRARSPIVSKGLGDNIEKLPASLYVAISEQMRRHGFEKPPAFAKRMREALAEENGDRLA